MTAWRAVDGGVALALKVTPRSARDAVEGLVDTGGGRLALQVRVRSAPSDGAANEAVLKLLARALDVPQRSVSLMAGAAARLKQIRVEGDAEAIVARLQVLAEVVRT